MHYYADIWQEFIRADKTLPATQRNYLEWHKGRDRYFLWAIDINDKSLDIKLNRIKQTLAPYLISPYTRQFHITLYVCGFMLEKMNRNDDFDVQLMAQQMSAIKKLELAEFEISLSEVNSFLSAPFVEVVDKTESLARVRNSLVAHRSEIRTTDYVPHITLGIYNNGYSCKEVSSVIEDCESLENIKFTINKLSLMSYSSEDIGSTLHVEHEIFLKE